MQWRKFYGRTMAGTLAQVRRALGPDALILETRAIDPGSPEGRLNPGARFEISAVHDRHKADGGSQMADSEPARSGVQSAIRNPQSAIVDCPQSAIRNPQFLQDLGALREQIRTLLDDEPTAPDAAAARVDLRDYHALIQSGVASSVLAAPFRAWLAWRTASAPLRRYLAQADPAGVAARMQGERLREWLWLAWGDRLGLTEEMDIKHLARTQPGSPRVVGLVGPTGGGKTTTLAKLASIIRHSERQKSVIVTLDTHRFGATEQWQRCAKLMGIPVDVVVSQEDLRLSMERWDRFDWVGIDTPGGLTPDSEAGRRYGALLAHCPHLETVMVLPATHEESVCRTQLERGSQWGAKGMIVTKLDETSRKGGVVNLTMDGQWRLHGMTMGSRVPDDWTAADRPALWRHVLADEREANLTTGAAS